MYVFNTKISDSINIKKLIWFAETKSLTNQILKEYIITKLVEDENALSYVCERNHVIGESLKNFALKDIAGLFTLFSNDQLKGYLPTKPHESPFVEYDNSIKALVNAKTPSELLDMLITHYLSFGAGKTAKYFAFKWDGKLVGIDYPDSISLSQLYCLDSQKSALIDNIQMFLKGLPYNNVILYGSRGSGKSSLIKATLNEYYQSRCLVSPEATRGLRMVEVSKRNMRELPEVINSIKNKNFKFIIYFDDLSFENDETEYKDLKVMLDGQIEKQPQNVLFCATSNRRHLINETWEERQGSDVRINDTLNEKLSLAERFGLSIYFPKIDKIEYLTIIENILKQRGIPFTDDIKADAIKWEIAHSGRSGRTAAQFAGLIAAKQNNL